MMRFFIIILIIISSFYIIIADKRLHRQHKNLHKIIDIVKKQKIYSGQPIYIDYIIARYCKYAGPGKIYSLANEGILWSIENYFPGKKINSYIELYRKNNFILKIAEDQVDKKSLIVLTEQHRSQRWHQLATNKNAKKIKTDNITIYYW